MHTPTSFTPSSTSPASVADTALVFAFHQRNLLIGGSSAAPAIPTMQEITAWGLSGEHHYLGELSGVSCIALLLDETAPPSSELTFTGLRSLFLRVPEDVLALASRAFQIIEWDRTHRFCGVCGAQTAPRPGERAKECPACGYVAYPRISPAMMVLVTRGPQLLLARANRVPPTSMYSALAGFVESGETIEDCIHREVKEEVGIAVKDLRYFGSQSWAFPHSLMIAFTAEYAGGELRLDDNEIAEARWFDVDGLPSLPGPVSIARRLIDDTVERLRAAR